MKNPFFSLFIDSILFFVSLTISTSLFAANGAPSPAAAEPPPTASAPPAAAATTAATPDDSTKSPPSQILTVEPQASPEAKPKKRYKYMEALIETSMGNIKVRLFNDKAPKTVENFVGLVEGTKTWTDPKTGEKVHEKPFYNGLTFHRVIPNFMIQGGDPVGNGTGGPGYQFPDEIYPDIHFDEPGRLAMANSGKDTNGSQFFITTVPTPWLDGKHTIFGEVVDGMKVVENISKAPRDLSNDAPLQTVKIIKIKIFHK